MKGFAISAIIFLSVNASFGEELLFGETCVDRVQHAADIGGPCSKQLKILCNHHDIILSLWDSSSRIFHTGLTYSNNMDLGNFDSCLSIDQKLENVSIAGKHCPYAWATAIPRKILEELVFFGEDLLRLIPSNISKLSVGDGQLSESDNITVLGSLCIPDACTVDEFTKVFTPYVYPVQYLNVDCITKDTGQQFSTFELIVTLCIGFIILTMVACTCLHAWAEYNNTGEPHDLIKGFSVLYNGRKLVKISTNTVDQIQCMNGIRFLCMLWVIDGHNFATYPILPRTNQKDGDEWRKHLYSQYIQAGVYAVDTFFFLSGFLLAYGYLKQVKDMTVLKQLVSIPLMYLHRYLRLTPSVAALFFVSLSFFRFLVNGPFWHSAINVVNDPCRTYWWRYFLYIQNYFPDNNMCYLQTWYLSADMQMFILAPLVLIPIAIFYRKQIYWVICGLTTLTVFCLGISIAILYIVKDYSNNYDTHSRLSNYLVGIIGGTFVYKNKGKAIKINRILNIVLWLIAIAVMLFVALYLNDVNMHPTKDKGIWFTILSRPLWSTCVLWVVCSCYYGYGGIINTFLSHPLFQVGARLSYSMYVVHVMVILAIYGRVRTYQYFSDYVMYYNFCGHVVTCLIVSLFWTLAFESPFIMLDKMLFSSIDSLLGRSKPKREIA